MYALYVSVVARIRNQMILSAYILIASINEYYRNTNYIVIRVDSNILYFTPDNRLQQVCTRSSFRNQKQSLKGKVFYFNKKTGFLDSIKYDHKDMKHSRTIVYDENGCIIRQ